jgi:site-specific DNA-cytosine methylase
MNAMYFDVPQSRERMIFIGVREDIWDLSETAGCA